MGCVQDFTPPHRGGGGGLKIKKNSTLHVRKICKVNSVWPAGQKNTCHFSGILKFCREDSQKKLLLDMPFFKKSLPARKTHVLFQEF